MIYYFFFINALSPTRAANVIVSFPSVHGFTNQTYIGQSITSTLGIDIDLVVATATAASATAPFSSIWSLF